jgi:hypothetical protein
MLIKKLAVPLINEKILSQAEHCTIATASISAAGFDFVRSRLSPKCKMEIVTGLDFVSSPDVLKRIWRHYLERISLKIYTKNFFHANVYIFDLPYRKSVAFVGSGHLTLEGLKDNEEVFTRINDPKEIEALKSWFVGYYEFAEPLTESLINEYDLIYPTIKNREIDSKHNKLDVFEVTTRGFSWENIKFKNQFFKKEDYQVFSMGNSSLFNPMVQSAREIVKAKLLEVSQHLQRQASLAKLELNTNHFLSAMDLNQLQGKRMKELAIIFGLSPSLLKKQAPAIIENFMQIGFALGQKYFKASLGARPGEGTADRELLQQQINGEEFRTNFFKFIKSLSGYRIEIFGETKDVESFANETALIEFMKMDEGSHFNFQIYKRFAPDDAAISNDMITATLQKEFDQLIAIYSHIRTV